MQSVSRIKLFSIITTSTINIYIRNNNDTGPFGTPKIVKQTFLKLFFFPKKYYFNYNGGNC